MILSIMVGPLRFYFVILCINYMIQWKFLNSGHYKFKSHLHLSRAYGTWNSPFWALGISTLVTDWLIAKNWICRAIVIFLYFWGQQVCSFISLFSESLSLHFVDQNWPYAIMKYSEKLIVVRSLLEEGSRNCPLMDFKQRQDFFIIKLNENPHFLIDMKVFFDPKYKSQQNIANLALCQSENVKMVKNSKKWHISSIFTIFGPNIMEKSRLFVLFLPPSHWNM